jgi:hypothetical protein
MAVSVPFYGRGSKKISIFNFKSKNKLAFVYNPNDYHMARKKS